MGGIGIPELLIILVIVLVIFGANKLPEIGSGMGRAIKDFKKASKEPDEIDISAQENQKDSAGSETDDKSENKTKS
ncbi:MAG: twin-arginine translocase TatA/TatE family subunit [Desulfohalobiaceae bacterium]|nr:twin-arginine translocase TatA/TatE family subunit [Desulfohalobiaceae bacterium]